MKNFFITFMLLSVMSMTAWAQGMAVSEKQSEGKSYWEESEKCYKARDYEGFFKNSKKSAKQKYSYGVLNLGRCYLYGHGTSKNINKAFNYFVEASELGCPLSYNYIGVCYSKGYGTSKSGNNAFYWYTKAAETGDGWGYYNIASRYYDGTKYEEQSFSKSAEYFAKAVECQQYGIEVLWNSVLTDKYFFEYKRGRRTPTNLYKQFPDAAYAYEYAFFKINPSTPEPFKDSFTMGSQKATKRIEELAAQGNPGALKLLHVNAFVGDNKVAKRDKQAAIAYFKGNTDKEEFQDLLIIAKGEGLYNEKIPTEWYNRRHHSNLLYNAADKGNAEAQYVRALEYELQGSYYNYKDWYKKAADNGHKLASIRYNQIVTKEKQEAKRREIAQKQQEAERQRLAAQAEKIRVEKFKKCQPGDIVYYSKKRSWEEGILFFKSAKEASCEIVCYVEKNVNNGERVQVRVADVKRSGDKYLEAVIDGVEFRRDEVKWIRPLQNKNWQIE